MTSTHSGRSCVATLVGSLLAFPVQAAPTLLAEASSGSSEAPTTPSTKQPPQQGQPGTPPTPPPAAYPQPGTYPPPGAYPYPYQPYGPPPMGTPYFPQPYYVPKPVDMRAPVLDYDPDQPIPPGYRLETHSRKGFLISGSVILGISWGLSMLIASSTSESSTSYNNSSSYYSSSSGVPFNSGLLYIPVVGPWLALGSVHDKRNCSNYSSYDYSECLDDNSSQGAWKFLLVTDGVAEVLGAGFIVLGLTLRSRQLVLTDNVQASIIPARIGSSGHGLAMVGSFGGL